jgi:Cullin family
LQQNNNVYDVYDLGLNLFHDNVVNDERIRDCLKSTLKEKIEKGRRGEAIDKMEIHNVSQMLSRLGNGTNSLCQEFIGEEVVKEHLVNKVSK